MRIIRFIGDDGEMHHGEPLDDQSATELTGSVVAGFHRTSRPLRITKLLAPIEPSDIICIGRNYYTKEETHTDAASDDRVKNLSASSRRQSSKEDGGHAPPDQTLEVFLKPSTALQHPFDPILVPDFNGVDSHLDCEGELAVLIGRDARNVSERDALNHIFGYTIANDVTARLFQTASGPPIWMRGKGFDTFCPIGPAIVTVDEVPDPNHLNIRTIINGQIVREGNTRDMISSVPQIIAALSRHMTLRAGAIVLTGAPPASPQFLRRADSIIVEVEAIGHLQNSVIGSQHVQNTERYEP